MPGAADGPQSLNVVVYRLPAQWERRNFYLTLWDGFMMRTQKVAARGLAVLDLHCVACRRVNALWVRAATVGRGGGTAYPRCCVGRGVKIPE